MYKWFLVWRYLHTKLIALLGVASVMLCVAMVLVVISVMGGFLDTIRSRARGLHSEIVMEGRTLQGFTHYEEFQKYLKANLSEVVTVSTPAIYTYGVFRIPANMFTKPVRVHGVRLSEYIQVNDFGRGLHYEEFFPGTTTLQNQRLPVAGVGPGGTFALPKDLLDANQHWRASVQDSSKIAGFDSAPFEVTAYPLVTTAPGDRVFAAAPEGPGYMDADHPGAIVGCDLIFDRRADGRFDRYLARGALMTVTLQAISPTGKMSGELPIVLPLRYADDSRTGIFEIDSVSMYMDFDILQRKLAMDPQPLVDGGSTRPRTNQLLMGLKPGIELNEARDRISAAWRSFLEANQESLTREEAISLSHMGVYTWEDLQRTFINAVEKEKVLITILFGLISLVAIVLIGCIFYMIVEKKTKDIGVLKSLGASSRGVAGMFILYAAAVGVGGAILGTLMGSLFVWNINGIQDWLASLNPALQVWSPEVYSFDRIPEVVKMADAAWVAILAVFSSMVGSIIPAVLAGRVWPVQALRYE